MKKLSALLVVILLTLSLVACQQDSFDMSDELNNIQTSQPGIEQEQQEQIDEQTGTNEESPRGELLFQDERVSIYAADDKGYAVTLVYGEYSQCFEGFNSLRPYCTTWEADADSDDTKELYLIHTIGSGTGVSEDALFVFEPNGENLDMYRHDSTEIQEEFNNSCSGVYLPVQQALQLSYRGKYHTVKLDDFINRDYLSTAVRTVLISGQQIDYSPYGKDQVQLTFDLSFESEEVFPLQSYLPENTMVSCLIRFNGAGFEVVEGLKFVYQSEYPWIAPVIEPMGYEEFFAEERSYHDLDASWYGYTRARGSMWVVESGDSGTAYELRSDENGFYICEYRDEEKVLYRVPNTEDLDSCAKAITNTWKLYCIKDGELLCVDVLTGQRDTLYTAGQIPDMMLCHNDVLYFLAIADGILSLNRLYVPAMTLDQLYTQSAPAVPTNCYYLCWVSTNRSVIRWETFNPLFWRAVTEILEGPESEYSELPYFRYFRVDYITAYPFNNEMVQLNFAMLQDKLDLRPRMRCYYDPVADTYEERYGIYDICFFGTGIHNDEEHFEDYPTYNNNDS